MLIARVQILIVIVIAWGFLVSNFGLLVEHVRICLIFLQVFEESNVGTDLALRILDVSWQFGLGQATLTIVVLIPNLVGFRGVDSVRVKGSTMLVILGFALLPLWLLHLKWVVMFRVKVLIPPFRMPSSSRFRASAPGW